jgi:thioredoxin 1
MAKQVTTENFKDVMNTDKPVLLDFWATWCAPCMMVAPSIEKISQKYEGSAVIGKVNIDEQRSLAEQFGVMSIPTVYVIKNSKVVGSAVGVRPQKFYEDMLDKAIAR